MGGNNNACQLQTALHLSLEYGNQQSCDILLMYMAMTTVKASINYQSIFSKLIMLKQFKTYLSGLTFQTR